MERLEAALEKARSDRSGAKAAVTLTTEAVKAVAPEKNIWEMVKEVKIWPRYARKNRITALIQGKQSGPYDLLRTRTLRQMKENGWSSLAITSPNKSCGKSTVAANLALSLSRQVDLKILVLDFDFRRPALHKILGHRPKTSLHEILAGEQPIETAFLRTGPNLAFALNSSAAANPSELIQSNHAQNRLAEIKNAFQPDVMIFDMPPMLASDENVGFLPSVDCGILIGAAKSTTISQLDICEKELSQLTNVLGVVLNKCKFSENDTDYDYY
ncbi:MAG: CpsD/CapB family tyrosine-protein kinase [Paracoccaceae bacterium]